MPLYPGREDDSALPLSYIEAIPADDLPKYMRRCELARATANGAHLACEREVKSLRAIKASTLGRFVSGGAAGLTIGFVLGAFVVWWIMRRKNSATASELRRGI
jgi:hypothetical protein